jgi:hypothetical protein
MLVTDKNWRRPILTIFGFETAELGTEEIRVGGRLAVVDALSGDEVFGYPQASSGESL